MGIQDVIRWFLPREDHFYDFLERHYPYLYLIDDRTGLLIETDSWKWLEKRAGAGKSWEDLYCTRNRVTTDLVARLRALYRRHFP